MQGIPSPVCLNFPALFWLPSVFSLAVNADTSNYEYSKKLLDLLQVVIDDDRRLTLFQSAARGLLDAGNREQASILAFNLAESMDDREKNIDQRSADFKAVQYKFFRQSIRIFPDNPIAARSLGYRLEQTGEEEEAMQLYRESLARSAPAWRLDLLLLLASTCSPFLAVAEQGDERCVHVSECGGAPPTAIYTRGK